MADEAQGVEQVIEIRDPNSVPVTFVNQVIGQGVLNGVINITFGTAQFTPKGGDNVDVDMVVSSRLRMDVICAQRLYEGLGAMLKQLFPDGEGKPN